MLSEKRMQRNRKWLEEERDRLEGELSYTAAAMDERERPGYGTHMADNATEVFEQAKNLAVHQRLRYTLSLIKKALEKMDKGTYGICEQCGEPIDPARLKALPYATLCMYCQARAEMRSSR
ncbi:MAG: TraR/DksA family transcriptional regulator [Anaerolineae bacterium]